MPTEDWIQESLARLESLEEERNRHEAALETSTDPAALRMNAQAIERLDAKIRSLYAELEAAAKQGDAEAADGEAADAELDADAESEGDEEEDDVVGGTTQMFRRSDLAAQAVAMSSSPQTVKQMPATAKIGQTDQPAAATPKVTPVAAAAVAAAATPVTSPFAASVNTPGAVASAPTASPFGNVAAPASAPAASPSAAPAASPFGSSASPATSAPAASPFGNSASPFGDVPQSAPFGSPPDTQNFGAPMTSNSSFDAGTSFDDESSGSSGSKMGIIIAVVVVLAGLGAYLAFGGKGDEPPPAAPTGPVKVIGGIEVPPDTQGPKTVQGSSDAIKGTTFKEGRPQPSGGGGGNNNPRPADKPAKKDPRAKIENADDPLAGIDK